jgi:hypothetical protein
MSLQTNLPKNEGHNIADELQIEIKSSALEVFVAKVDDLHKLAILQHYNLFHFVNETLLPSSTKAMLF